MTLYELWMHAPECFVFIREGGGVREYIGGKVKADQLVKTVKATSYPNYRHVLEVTLEQ